MSSPATRLRLKSMLLWIFATALLLIILAQGLSPRARIAHFCLFIAAVYFCAWVGVWCCLRLKPKALLIGALLFHLSLAATLCLIELGAAAGFFDFRLIFGTLGDQPWVNPLNRTDIELLHLHKPKQRLRGVQATGDIARYLKVGETRSYPYDVVIDSQGFRNTSDYTSAEVAVIGDSFIEAATVAHEQMLTAVLERRLGRATVNLGQLWYGPQQELAVLKRFALPLKPKTILWMFFGGNDLSDTSRYERVRKEWGQSPPNFHGFAKRSFLRNALLASFLGVRTQAGKKQALSGSCAVGSNAPSRYFYYLPFPLKGEKQQQFQRAIEVLRAANEVARAAGSRLVIVYVPTKYEVYHDVCKFSSPPNEPLPAGNLVSAMQLELSRFEDPPEFFDLIPALKTALGKGEQQYYMDDTHWTPAGNRTAAVALATFLREEG